MSAHGKENDLRLVVALRLQGVVTTWVFQLIPPMAALLLYE